jgi:transposase-like protein
MAPFPAPINFQPAQLWLSGASLRATRDAMDHKAIFSHEAVRQWAHRLGHHLDRHNQREVIAVDETSPFTQQGREVFGWVALDAATREVFLTWVTQRRSSLEG